MAWNYQENTIQGKAGKAWTQRQAHMHKAGKAWTETNPLTSQGLDVTTKCMALYLLPLLCPGGV